METKQLLWLAVITAALTPAGAPAATLTACGAQFDTSCAAPTPGGYTFVNPLPAQGATEITGYNSANAVIFHQIIPTPPSGAAGLEVQLAVLQAQAQVALQSGQAGSLPACTANSSSVCRIPAIAGSTVTTSSVTSSYTAIDTLSSQRDDVFATMVIGKLNGGAAFSLFFSVPFSDPIVQSAILEAEAALGGNAAFGTPLLTAGSTALSSSQVSFVQTGIHATGNSSTSTSSIFGPGYVIGCSGASAYCLNLQGRFIPVLYFIPPTQIAINTNIDIEFGIDRKVITTNTFLTTQTYEINGITSTATPEPAASMLVGAGLLAAASLAAKRKR